MSIGVDISRCNTIQKLAEIWWKGGKIADALPPKSVTLHVVPQ
jgi:glycerate-2-kinase